MASRKQHWNWVVLALSVLAGGCILPGGDPDPLKHPGPPVGLTSLHVPWNKLVIPVTPPTGFSSTYQKMVVDRQRLARKKAESDAQAKATPTKDGADSAARPATPPA